MASDQSRREEYLSEENADIYHASEWNGGGNLASICSKEPSHLSGSSQEERCASR